MTKRMITAEEFARAVGARRSGAGWQARCPAHHDRNPSLSISEGADGRLLLHCFSGCSFEAILAAVPECGSGGVGAQYARAYVSRNPQSTERGETALRIWREARSAAGTLAQTYLEARGAWLPDGADLRYAPRLQHQSGHIGPAMVGAIRDATGEIIGVHRTWIRLDGSGKADLSNPKMMLGRAAGGAVRLIDRGAALIVGEGIETTLSVAMAIPEARAWAALSAGGLEKIDLG